MLKLHSHALFFWFLLFIVANAHGQDPSDFILHIPTPQLQPHCAGGGCGSFTFGVNKRLSAKCITTCGGKVVISGSITWPSGRVQTINANAVAGDDGFNFPEDFTSDTCDSVTDASCGKFSYSQVVIYSIPPQFFRSPTIQYTYRAELALTRFARVPGPGKPIGVINGETEDEWQVVPSCANTSAPDFVTAAIDDEAIYDFNTFGWDAQDWCYIFQNLSNGVTSPWKCNDRHLYPNYIFPIQVQLFQTPVGLAPACTFNPPNGT